MLWLVMTCMIKVPEIHFIIILGESCHASRIEILAIPKGSISTSTTSLPVDVATSKIHICSIGH